MFKKIKYNKKTILACLICSLVVGIVGVSATTLLYSKDVTYDNSSSGMSATTVQGALDELYAKAKSAPSCDSNGNCTVTCPSGTDYVTTSTGYWCGVTARRQILAKTNVVTSGSGLYSDSTEVGRYYYSGSDPNNKIVFNGEPYRILSIENDGSIKIMKMVSIGTQKWHTTSSGTANLWASSSLKSYLEETWLSTQKSGENYQHLVTNNRWYVGAVSSSTDIAADYTNEKTLIVNSVVGLISVSEYLKSKYSGSTFLTYSNYWWTISPLANSTYCAWYVDSSGLGNSIVSGIGYYEYTAAVFPVLFLKSTVSLTGYGTSTNPYCISGSSCPTNLNFTQRAS